MMNTKNYLYLSMGCHILSTNYAITNYLTPSIVMACMGAGLSLFIAFPSKNDRWFYLLQVLSITLFEIALLSLTRIDFSNNSFSFLIGCNAISCVCWSTEFNHLNKRKRKELLDLVEKMMFIFMSLIFIIFILPDNIVSAFVQDAAFNQSSRLLMLMITVNLFTPMMLSCVYGVLYRKLIEYRIHHKREIEELSIRSR